MVIPALNFCSHLPATRDEYEFTHCGQSVYILLRLPVTTIPQHVVM